MHSLQAKLLNLAKEKNLGQFTLREMGGMVGESSPQKIKHHLQQLEKRGLVRIDKAKRVIEKVHEGWVKGFATNAKLLNIPIYGAANAGPARAFGEQNLEGYLRISSNILTHHYASRRLFALRVDGPSMNRAEVNGKKLEDGDYIIIDSEVQKPKSGDIVLSIIDGMANVKRYYEDKENNQIVLLSDSTHDFPPIYIHKDDDYHINGKVVQVIKKPKMNV